MLLQSNKESTQESRPFIQSFIQNFSRIISKTDAIKTSRKTVWWCRLFWTLKPRREASLSAFAAEQKSRSREGVFAFVTSTSEAAERLIDRVAVSGLFLSDFFLLPEEKKCVCSQPTKRGVTFLSAVPLRFLRYLSLMAAARLDLFQDTL